MSQQRMNRVNEEVKKVLGQILRQVKDPRVSKALISVTAVSVTPDLKFAKVYYSAIGRCDEKEVAEGLKSASGYIRREVAAELNLRLTPSFTFIRDRSAEKGAHIAELLKSVEADLTPEESAEAASDATPEKGSDEPTREAPEEAPDEPPREAPKEGGAGTEEE